MGMIGSLIIGTLLDRVGLELCTALTLLLGLIHMVAIYPTTATSKSWMVISFWIYMLFRNFLYPVYISSLTDRLGFKYFGVLLGIGFALSGLVQLSMTAVDEWAQGDCHELSTMSSSGGTHAVESSSISSVDGATIDSSGEATCNHGWWGRLHVVQFIQLGCLMVCPLLDRWEIQNRKAKLAEMMAEAESSRTTASKSPSSTSYGSV